MLLFGVLLTFLTHLADPVTPFAGEGCAAYAKYRCPGGKSYPIHLTFDDGPAGANTSRVLDVLKEQEVPATFFVMGEKLDKGSPAVSRENWALIRRMRAEGHLVGSHSYRHVMHSQLSEAQIRDYVSRAKNAGREELGNYLSPLFRLPWGSGWYDAEQIPDRSHKILSVLANEGFTHVGWDISSWDWDVAHQNSPGILHIILRKACETHGGVVLLHDTQAHTARHLDEWIRAIRCAGHFFVSLKALMKPDLSNDARATFSCLEKSESVVAAKLPDFVNACSSIINRLEPQ